MPIAHETYMPEVLRIIESSVDSPDLVTVDMIMAGVEGSMVFDVHLQIRPDLPVLLASGYTIDGNDSTIVAKRRRGFIQRPFILMNLSHRVDKTLSDSLSPDVSS